MTGPAMMSRMPTSFSNGRLASATVVVTTCSHEAVKSGTRVMRTPGVATIRRATAASTGARENLPGGGRVGQ